MLNGRIITAREASSIGLLDRVVPSGDAATSAIAWAAEIAQRPSVAVQAAKRAIMAAGRPDGYDVEVAAFAAAAASDDMPEGVSAFLEKRTPCFTHQ